MSTHLVSHLEQEQKLRELGLGDYTSRAYIALLKLGPSDARAVSRLGRVPVAKIYSTLDQLAEKGLCAIEPGPPKRFSPVPIADYLDKLSAQREAEARAAQDAKVDLARLFPIAPGALADDRGTFQVLRGRAATMEKLRLLYANASERILVRAGDNMLARKRVAGSFLREAHDRGVRARMMARVDAETIEGLSDLAGVVELRAKPSNATNVAVGVFDGERALVIHFVPDDGSSFHGKDVALYTDQQAVVRALESFLETEWDAAETLEDARARIARGEPQPFWRALLGRESVLDATRRLVEDGAREMRGCSTIPPSVLLQQRGPPFLLAERGGSARYLLPMDSTDEVSAAEKIMQEAPRVEVRHAALGAGVAYSVWDDVALYGVRLVTMTNDQTTVASLRRHFETAWAAALTTVERREELARYPGLPARERFRMFETLFDDVPMGITIFDRDLRVVFVNRAGLELRGDRSDAPGRLALDAIAGVQDAPRPEMAKRVLETGGPERQEFLHPSGQWFECEMRRFGIDLVIATFRDVSDLRRARARLPRAGPAAGWCEMDAASSRVRYSPELRTMLGLPEGEDQIRMDLVHPGDREAVARMHDLARSQPGRFEIEWRLRRGDGRAWMRTTADAVAGANGRVERVFFVVRELGPAD